MWTDPPYRMMARGEKRTAVDVAYAALAPAAFGVAHLAARARGATPRERRERAGDLPTAGAPLFWFHGASAGEMTAAAKLVALLRCDGHAFTAGYTATNRAGVELAARLADPAKVVALVPWDVAGALRRAFDRWRPAVLFLVETELWPGLIFTARRRGVPVVVVSARIYPRDVPRYQAIRALMQPTLDRLTMVLAQDETERNRFLHLGVAPERCVVAGNLKHVDVDEGVMNAATLRRELGLLPDERIVVCGSVHRDEVETVFGALDPLGPDPVRFVIAPRQRTAVGPIIAAARQRGWRVVLRSAGAATERWRVLVLDTMGELTAAYALASVAVAGGAFGFHGGHDPFAPVRSGAPVLFGGDMTHFACEADALAQVTPEARTVEAGALGRRLRHWLTDEAHRERTLARQRTALPASAAIAERYRGALAPLLAGSRE